jgi:hypothetical protein
MQATKLELHQLATKFRKAILSCPRANFSAYQRKHLQDFPTQSCDVASLLLAYYLREKGCEIVEKVSGCRNFGRPDEECHAWLEVDGWIVDITADQFQDLDDPVIVTAVKGQTWHSHFREQSRGPAYCPRAVKAEYDAAYAALQKRID